MYSTSFYTKEPEPPQPRNIPREIDVTIMCSIVSTASPSSQSSTTSLHSSTTISGSPSVIFTSGTTELAFPLADSHLYVTVDGVYDTSLHCDAQIPLCELLRLVEPIGCSAEGRGDDESTAELSMSYSLASSQNSQVTHVEIEDISKEIVQLITLNYDDIAGEYSIVLPDDDESSVQSEDKQLVDVSGMTGDEALQLIKGIYLELFYEPLTWPRISILIPFSWAICSIGIHRPAEGPRVPSNFNHPPEIDGME